MEYKEIEKAVKAMKTIPLERTNKKTGKTTITEYPMVTEKVKAFKSVYPDGSITTELIKDDGVSCLFKATIKDGEVILGTGYAKEEKQASFINQTSYIENCETSAVGRALSFAGFGGDASIASAEEVANAIQNQNKGKIDQLSANGIYAKAKKDGVDIEKICKRYGVKKLEELTAKEGEYIINNWSKEVIPNCKA